jgi:hypothetical protein
MIFSKRKAPLKTRVVGLKGCGSEGLEDLACQHSRDAAPVPLTVEAVAAPDPSTAVPIEEADVSISVWKTVDRPPEENHLAPPIYRGRQRIPAQVVENMCRKDRLPLDLLLDLVARDDPVTTLAGNQVQADLVDTQTTGAGQTTSDLILGVDAPAIGDVGVGVEVERRIEIDLQTTSVLQELNELLCHSGNVVDERLKIDTAPWDS